MTSAVQAVRMVHEHRSSRGSPSSLDAAGDRRSRFSPSRLSGQDHGTELRPSRPIRCELPTEHHASRLADTGLLRQQVRLVPKHRVDGTALIAAWALAFEVDRAILQIVEATALRTVLFTNNGPMLDLCLQGPLHAIADVFDDIICSWHLKATKPDPIAFNRAADRLGCQPAEILLLDDSPVNVDSAIRAGWRSLVASCAEDVTDAIRSVG